MSIFSKIIFQFLGLAFFFCSPFLISPVIANETISEVHQEKDHVQVIEHDNDHTNSSPLFFIIIAVIIGALTRFALQKSALPFTVVLLIIGLFLGVLSRLNYFDIYEIGSFIKIDFSFFDQSIDWAANIDPHLLLYVFLPILIFEAAFAMDVHVFKKSFSNATLLAVPGIIVAIALSAGFVILINKLGIGLGKWDWPVALLFGAVISATDPVAVVSILKELGVSKKLGTLIEGESLLNDGTAIVIFMVIFAGLTGSTEVGSPILEFFRVSFGGVIVGLLIGWIIIGWVKRVFNDIFVEITAIIGAAYLVFFVAEYFLHVSGVLALVAFGLLLASYGRTKISPEVQHFLHQFWELSAFIANTLIFIIVGVVIAKRTVFGWQDVVLLGIVYIGVFVVRAVVIGMFYPTMRKLGYSLSKKDAYVLWYGALRGVIGLALALIFVDSEMIDKEIRDQFLFLTAGIVTLTLLINATTIKLLVNKLGLTKVSPAKEHSQEQVKQYLLQSSEKAIMRLKEDRFLVRSNWETVRGFLPKHKISNELSADYSAEMLAESRRRILEKEKSSYWRQFKDGLLGDEAFRILIGDINQALDSEGKISERNDLENLLNTNSLLKKTQNLPLISRFVKPIFFEKLTTSFDSAKGFIAAQDDSLKLLESMYRQAKEIEKPKLKSIEDEINENKIQGMTFLRNLGKEYPEIYNAISTREAIRSMLNFEKHTIERLLKRGRITDNEAEGLISDVEIRMKTLRDNPHTSDISDTKHLLMEVPWLNNLDHITFNKISERFQSKVFSPGDVLVTEREIEDGMYIIIRGTANVSIKGESIDLLGPGSAFGELASLNNNKRAATVTADSPLTTLWISSNELKNIVEEFQEVKDKVWTLTGKRYAFYLLR